MSWHFRVQVVGRDKNCYVRGAGLLRARESAGPVLRPGPTQAPLGKTTYPVLPYYPRLLGTVNRGYK